MARGRDVALTGVMLAQEALSALHLPGSSALGRAVNAAYERRRAAARQILLEAIEREGVDNIQFEPEEMDDFVQMMMRFAKAAETGAARQNLKLLAQVIFGLKRNRAFEFDQFQACANVLETLTRDEIVFLGRMYQYYTTSSQGREFLGFLASISDTFESSRAYVTLGA